jgi:Protein of unknown function (DUF3551)
MRLLLFILGFSVGIACIEKPAEAQNYPWCAHYGTGFEGMNCGFVTFQQCLDTVSGIGGFCMQNNTYQPRQVPGPRARRTRTSLR